MEKNCENPLKATHGLKKFLYSPFSRMFLRTVTSTCSTNYMLFAQTLGNLGGKETTLALQLYCWSQQLYFSFIFFVQLHFSFLDPWLLSKGSYKIGSVLLSVLPSVLLFVLLRPLSFLRIGSLVFSETQFGVRGPCMLCDSWIFWKKSPSRKNDQKWSKMPPKTGFWTF